MAQFTAARLKIQRADHHIKNIEARIEALNKTNTSIVEIHPEHGTDRLIHTCDLSAFDDLGLMVGDAVHNLKCALDYTWLQTIERFAPSLVGDRAKFPVRKTIEEVKGYLAKAEVHILCPKLYCFMLDMIQPCDGGNDAIWPIHNFDNRDKHRLLIPVLGAGNIDGIKTQDESGEIWPGYGIGDFQRPPYCIDFPPGVHVKQNGKLTAQIGVEDEKSGCFMRIPETLVFYSHVISETVVLFARFYET